MVSAVESHTGLIHSVAWSFHRTTGMPIDDLIGEASLAFVEACLKHKPEKAKLSTFAVLRMRNHLADWLDRERERSRCESPLPVSKDEEDKYDVANIVPALRLGVTPERLFDFKERLMLASPDCKALCQIVFDSPEDFLDRVKAKRVKGRLKKSLRERGWSWPRIWAAFRQVENIVDGENPED